MSAYHMGLTGNAAQWAVQKQKGHRSVSKSVMMHLDQIWMLFSIKFSDFEPILAYKIPFFFVPKLGTT